MDKNLFGIPLTEDEEISEEMLKEFSNGKGDDEDE